MIKDVFKNVIEILYVIIMFKSIFIKVRIKKKLFVLNILFKVISKVKEISIRIRKKERNLLVCRRNYCNFKLCKIIIG